MPIQRHARLQPQRVARAQPAWANVPLLARLQQRVPQLLCRRYVAGQVDLEPVFTRVSGARNQHVGHAGHFAPGKPIIFDCRQINFGQLLQDCEPARPLHGQLRVAGRVVRDPNLRHRSGVGHNPCVVLVLVARIHHQQVVVLARPVHQQVVHEAALRRQQRGVVRLAVL